MGLHTKPDVQEVLDQIMDIVTNRYEAEFTYTAEELRQILDAIVAVLDHQLVVPGTNGAQELLASTKPLVLATIRSDDHARQTRFVANRWFIAATDTEIEELASVNWRYDLEADRIAYFMEPLDLNVELVLDYCRSATKSGDDPIGFEVSVDSDTAMAWLAVYRPAIYERLRVR